MTTTARKPKNTKRWLVINANARTNGAFNTVFGPQWMLLPTATGREWIRVPRPANNVWFPAEWSR